MRRSRSVAILLTSSLVGVGSAAALITPGRSVIEPRPVVALSQTFRHLAWATGVSPDPCSVRLWITERKALYTFKPGLDCTVETSTGTGIATVSVAERRVLWLAYTGGNIREWSLFTATPTQKTPKRLRFVSRDVDGPAPIVLGQGTRRAVPFAVDAELTYLGDNGAAIFKKTLPSAVRSVVAGQGPGAIRVAALLASGDLVALRADGSHVFTRPAPAGSVTAFGLFTKGVALQIGTDVHLLTAGSDTLVSLEPGARMLDAGMNRILYAKAGDLWALRVATGERTLLVEGSTGQPVFGQSEPGGAAWYRGSTVSWRTGHLP
jgi:hypothetical protein